MGNWLITDKGDPEARNIVDGVGFDGKPHYSRQTPGAAMFTRNGQNLVFITRDKLAAWVTWRPTPGKAVRKDGLNAWENALFCNRGELLSSSLIREATELSCAIWGPFPPDGFITYIKSDAVKTEIKGYCYRRAGWRRVGASKDGKPMLRAPRPKSIGHWSNWEWNGERGGKLRNYLEARFALEKAISARASRR